MASIRVVFPTEWDQRQLGRVAEAEGHTVQWGEPDDDACPWDFDVLGYVEEEVARGGFDGVFSSSDYPGATVAGAIATRLGLPGTPPERVIRCSHKYYSRVTQREAAPEATPRFWLVDPDAPPDDLVFPCFVKPVKGAFSVMSARIGSRRELDAFLRQPAAREFLSSYVDIFNRLVRGLTDLEVDGRAFVAEALLTGRQATVEGYVGPDGPALVGVVDSVRHPKTKSFVRFNYPSSLPRRLQEKAWDVSRRAVLALGLEHTMFNVEVMVDAEEERVSIVEINPRMCGQFADLYEKVDGVSGYAIALALAAGAPPPRRRREGGHAVASSVPLRIFEPSLVERAPSDDDLRRAEALFDGTLCWSECETGARLDDFHTCEDGKSARYGIVNLGAPSREALKTRLAEVKETLGFRMRPLRDGAPGG